MTQLYDVDERQLGVNVTGQEKYEFLNQRHLQRKIMRKWRYLHAFKVSGEELMNF